VRLTDPDWVAYNLAIFICKRCADIHQSLGSHISKLKPVDDEDWTEEQLQVSVILVAADSLPISFILHSIKVQVKASHTRYRALGPELIPVYRQSARR